MIATSTWHPSASLQTLQLRAQLLNIMRSFFAERGIWEVDTPALSMAGTTDPNLHSFTTYYQGFSQHDRKKLYLHTSPEFPMKQLLAAGSGCIYQIAKVFRDGECGRYHNPEFTLLEWYRVGFDHHQLMNEVEALIDTCLTDIMVLEPPQYFSYREIFLHHLNIDPHLSTVDELRQCCLLHDLTPPIGMPTQQIDAWLDLLLTHCIEPQFNPNRLIFIYDYPASQAALAKIRPSNPPVAERFEVYLNGIELANGFHELADSQEQRQRFEWDNHAREQQGLPTIPLDEHLLAILDNLPDCAGVALGIDRLMMITASQSSLSEVIAFPFQHPE